MVIKVVLFDFDGIIVDIYDVFFVIVNCLVDEFGYLVVDKIELVCLKKLSFVEIIKYF